MFQCSILRNKCELPATLSLSPYQSISISLSLSTSLSQKKKQKQKQKTRESLTAIDFSNNDILKIIRNLDPNKAHGHDMISIRMVKICDDFICKPLKLMFQSCSESDKFTSKWKKAIVVPIHKRGDKQILKNCRPISLLITGKRGYL